MFALSIFEIMTEINFLHEVSKEMVNLRNTATEVQKERLLLRGNIYPDSSEHCIYGQMCLGCNSGEAIELMDRCAKPLFRDLSFHSDVDDEMLLPEKKFIDQESVQTRSRVLYSFDVRNNKSFDEDTCVAFTALEYYISCYHPIVDQHHLNDIANFIKGLTDQVELMSKRHSLNVIQLIKK